MRTLAWALLLLAASCGGGEPPSRYQVDAATTADGTALVILRDAEAGIAASVAPTKGGELSGLRVRRGEDWIETIHLAEDYSPREEFGGKAPLLWPATGRSLPADSQTEEARGGGGGLPGSWDLDGTRYPMGGHGFARDMAWSVDEQGADADGARLRLRLAQTAQTMERYPFGFELSVEYVLRDGTLELNYRVAAADDNEGAMPFSIGNHITFRTPLVEGSALEDTVFATASTTRLLKDDFGFPNGESEPRSHAEGIGLDQWEPRVPISLTGYEGEPWVEIRDPAGLTVRVAHRASEWPAEPYIAFNVWGDPAAGFLSPEPWVGMQNSLNSGLGLIRLEAGEVFDWTITLDAGFER